ncbi:MAG: wax ester/triacylglycerol synthase family O-acyltransferase [Steroidobacteraceae bacterium]|jgi:WS/DGAT/MGAT family acyltransferase|nr:wax ester/triacylglycerol synthase family O-acyltransferase [Steroidobacteraceae bacterium]
MKPVKLLDAAFLHIETPATPMHVGALFVLAPAPGRGDFFPRFRRLVAARLGASEVFTRLAAPLPLSLANPFWVTARSVDLDHHVRLHRLPEPGGRRELEDCVARLHETPLDRSRPLWELHVIEGYEGPGRAIYVKVHHAGLDGHSAQLFLRSFVDETRRGGRQRSSYAPRGAAPDPARLLAAGAAHQLSEFRRLPAHLAGLVRTAASVVRDAAARRDAASPAVPTTPLNVVISGRRSFACVEVGLDEAKAIARAAEATINDVVLAAVSGALRAWLRGRECLPEAPLYAGVPVSVRAPGATEHAIQVAFIAVNLHTHEARPGRRLAAIHLSAAGAKESVATFRMLVPEDSPSIGMPWLIGGLGQLLRLPQVADRIPLPFNVIVSNVPGPPQEFFIAGSRVLTYYPLSIPFHRNALNISAYSYAGRLFFGLTACPDAVPDVEAIADGIAREFEALRRAGPPARRRRKGAA